VPFDEGTLAGAISSGSRWPDGDWRNDYFGPENLEPSVRHYQDLVADLAGAGNQVPLPELALRFILASPAVATVIPGMRTPAHVAGNLGVSDGRPLEPALLETLRRHRWDRVPGPWSG
jgi:aryl-alcohol dehydrogenase-like predicted oxidoreductase